MNKCEQNWWSTPSHACVMEHRRILGTEEERGDLNLSNNQPVVLGNEAMIHVVKVSKCLF